MQQTKEKAPRTTAIVQSAKTEPSEAQTYLTATDIESQMFRDPERIVNLYKTQIAASGEEISENALRLIDAAAQLQRVLDLIKGGDRKVCFQVSGTCLAGAGIDDGDSAYIDFDHYPRKPLYRSRGDHEDRTDVCMCFARYPGAKEPALMLKQYLGVSFMAQTVGTCYKDRTNCAFPATAILGVVYAVFDAEGHLKWSRDPEEYSEELTTKDTMKYVDIEPCGSLHLSN